MNDGLSHGFKIRSLHFFPFCYQCLWINRENRFDVIRQLMNLNGLCHWMGVSFQQALVCNTTMGSTVNCSKKWGRVFNEKLLPFQDANTNIPSSWINRIKTSALHGKPRSIKSHFKHSNHIIIYLNTQIPNIKKDKQKSNSNC